MARPHTSPTTPVRTGVTEFSIFAEARFGTHANGAWAATTTPGGPHAWEWYGRNGNQVRAVVRADRRPNTAEIELPAELEVVPLPYYIGVRALVRTLPALVVAVWRAVAGAETIVLRVPGVMGSLAALVCRLLRRRYAVEVIGDPADVLRSGALGPVGIRLAGLARVHMRWLVRGAAASVFVTRHALQRRYPPRPGTPTAGVSNVRLGAASFVSQGRHWRPGPFKVVTIGSQEAHYKGHDVLLKALRRLVDGGVDIFATVVGGGRSHEEIVALARRLGLADRVTFTGELNDRARIIEILDSADLFAFPSRTEGLPKALVEAMSRALPSVGSNVGGIPELLDPSYLVPVDDDGALAKTMARLLSDPFEWELQSRRSLSTAKTYAASLLEDRRAAWLGQVPAARRRPARGSRT